MTALSTSQELKQYTQKNHLQLEKVMVNEIHKITSELGYVLFLKIFYGYFAGLEVNIAQFVDKNELSDYPKRRKTSLLSNDLISLGASLPSIATDEELPTINNLLQAFGALYVMEGSTLGGQYIANMIKEQLQWKELKAVSFFEGYGSETVGMWESFKTVLDEHATTKEDLQTILKSSDETFVKFKSWFEKQVND
jgi:heme oxygenase